MKNSDVVNRRKLPFKVRSNNTEKGIFYIYLLKHTATGTMAAVATGIAQKKNCRYKRQLENDGLLCQIKQAVCKVTGCKAFYLTTNPNKLRS